MSFHTTAQDIRVDDGHMLRARLFNEGGDAVDAEYNLNDCLGNSNGSFEWGGNNFAASAEDIRFTIEGEGVPILRARLFTVDGEAIDRDVNLAERIGNDNGRFIFNC
ncbi:CVNH domain-containing protein [Colletotrichum sublineola]|uniref:Putative CVNH domain-containing protein n=1 Tax=Colletotrichum sublineola TaxID=1173701 RepID=A0A066XAR4_COLSU|nr:CVNH domain-containing protein [Colletotrichum sublineola]KDN66253.1 putative CVNH domain-containing protein [Colletotrichum sublineola]